MAHELDIQADNAVAFVTARQPGWHQLGTVLPDTFTAEDAMTKGLLGGWNVRKEQLYARVNDSNGKSTQLAVPNRFATVRTNPSTGKPEYLGVVGSYYEVIQNEEHCEFLNAVVEQSGAHFETAGALRGGREVFVTMKVPQTMQIGGEDAVDTYVAMFNAHDGTAPLRLATTLIRVECANTQAAALRNFRGLFAIRHTSGARDQIALARQALDLTFKYAKDFEVEAEKMIQTSLRDVDFINKARRIFRTIPNPNAKPKPEKDKGKPDKLIEQLRHLFTESDTNLDIRGTRWAGYQAITEYLDHYMPVRDTENADKARAERAITAPYITDLKIKAFDAFAVK